MWVGTRARSGRKGRWRGSGSGRKGRWRGAGKTITYRIRVAVEK